MSKFNFLIIISFLTFSSCSENEKPVIAAFEVYCEMVANEAKPLALHYPMEGKEIDRLWDQFTLTAKKHNVLLKREDNFPASLLFPAEMTTGKTVVLIYNGQRLEQYKQLKTDLLTSSSNVDQEALARRFGRLLGYTSQGVNDLLIKNSDYRNLMNQKVSKQITHLYYKNPEIAIDFYKNIIGLNTAGSNLFQISDDTFIKINEVNKEHPEGQAKSTAIAFLTDQLPKWYAHLNERKVPIKYTYKPKKGGPHDGFVAIDPEGYLLEFEQFKQHPENELLIASLANTSSMETSVESLSFNGTITWTYHTDLLLMKNFYEEVLGYRLVADQGWTKIFQTSPIGFIGLVDERRGMEDYAEFKAVEIEWEISDFVSFDAYASKKWGNLNYKNGSFKGPENYIYHIK